VPPLLPSKVNLHSWALVAEIAGALAVIVSVLYLGRQINGNTQLLRSQAHYNALSLAQRPLELMVENESLAGVVSQCDAAPNTVSGTNWERCLNYYFIQFNSWEYMYYQNQDGSIPKQLWVGADAYFKTLAHTKPGYVRFWGEMQVAFDEPFGSYAKQEFQRQPANPASAP
jgi:hypothetical protein